MRRRDFFTLLGGAAAGWPRGARAQQQPASRRIGLLTSAGLDDIEGQARYAAFVEGLQQLGWIEGHNIRIDARWGSGNIVEICRHVAELVALVPDAMLVAGSAAMGPMLDVTRSVPIVFTQVPDPVGAGYVDSMARPGGNVTGFTPLSSGSAVSG